MLRRPLPDDLPQPFTVAEARAAGVPHRRTQAADLNAPFHGVRLPAGLAESRLAQLRALSRLTPHAAASHQTAAAQWHLPLPLRLQHSSSIHLTVPADHHRIEHRGVVGHVADRQVVRLSNGLLVTRLDETWCDLAPALSLGELVEVADAIVNREGWDLRALTAAVQRARRRRGCRKLRAALPLVRPGSGSPRETRCRLLFDAWGLPEPGLNVDLYGAYGWVACVDFLWPGARVVAEYYGSVHGPTWRADLARAALVADTGYSVVVITDEDLKARQAALRQRLERLLGRL